MAEDVYADIDAILSRLPHRYPFLLVDRILSYEAGKSMVALKNVTANEAYFQGHFPDDPVMPGVLITESLAQAAGLLAWEIVSGGKSDTTAMLYLVGIDKARIKRPVRPGDQLMLHVTFSARKRAFWRFDCRAQVGGKLAAQAEILMSIGKGS
jgi:3-hydroxyacyl-[acyl-carrier-protein] dehydratase